MNINTMVEGSGIARAEEEVTNGFIPVAAPVIGDFEIECVTDAIRSGWVSSIGPYIDNFEVVSRSTLA